MQQLIREPTRINNTSQNLRDLIFINNVNIITSSGTLSSFSHLDHFPIYVTVQLTPPSENAEPIHTYVWDYQQLNAPLLTNLLQNTDWTHILDNDIDTATDLFISAIHNAAAASIPIKRKTKQSNQKPWATSELKRNIRKRDRLFKIAKQTPCDFN